MSNEDIKKMDMKEFEVYESNRIEKNAWAMAEELQRRLDDAPMLGEYIKALLTEKSNNGFFFIWDYLPRYMEASEVKREDLPGHAYFKKIWDFYNAHYNTGELFMEYLKKDCFNKDENYAISARHMTGWDQARKEYLSQFQIPITLTLYEAF